MSSYKRKFEELEDSDDEEPSLGRQILPVANLPEDFNGEPVDDVPFICQDEHRRLMPDKKERDHWWGFLAGKPASHWNPPKAPKQTAAQRRLSGFTSSPDTSPEQKNEHSWQTNDEGEVELVLRVDPSESLPTPTGSPAPPDFGEPGPSTIASSRNTHEAFVYKPRGPLPSLLRHIDEVSEPHLIHRLLEFTWYLFSAWLCTF
ncbi:hypothetical protein DXG03_000245 [Asterophora parasitica]|uniref:Uncharacterized protein n=1 Tax=Asterophora parasitica TaxID=117018 RepID=A0A9P7KE93_9AGAR|nr:hypothetical protein DXG03_000245 [Asterophora parasitica]